MFHVLYFVLSANYGELQEEGLFSLEFKPLWVVGKTGTTSRNVVFINCSVL